MATEVRLILWFDDYPPATEDIEYALGCTVLELVEEEV